MSGSEIAPAMIEQVEVLYAKAKAGKWEDVWMDLVGEREFASACSRYRKPSSGWTFLHQAAYWNSEAAVRVLLRLGTSLSAKSKDDETAHDIAHGRGHAPLALLLRSAELRGPWTPSLDPDLLPSSNVWAKPRRRYAWRELHVGYGSGRVVIPTGARYYVDPFDRVLVGWHGTYDPPAGMDGESMIEYAG